MKRIMSIVALGCIVPFLAGCDKSDKGQTSSDTTRSGDSGEAHVHEDGSSHADHADDTGDEGEDHAHDEVSLGKVTIGEMEVELAQGHGKLEAGQEGHLVVKLPYNDKGETVVRAWIGTEDRTQSYVGKGEYAPSHDDYDVHGMAPDPLPENVMWWIEIEKPDGTKVVGSAKSILE